MRRALALALLSLFCVLPLLARAGGWFSPSSGNVTPLSHTIFGSGGPLDGFWESTLSGDYSVMTTFDDFNFTFPDAGTLPATLANADEWISSGFTITGTNTPAGGQFVRARGGGLLVIYAGTGVDDSVNLQHNALGVVQIDPTSTVNPLNARVVDMPLCDTFSNAYYANTDVFWAASLVWAGGGATWDGAAVIGCAVADTQILNNTTGTLTDATWSTGADGGVLFYLSPTRQLSVNVKRGATITSQSVDLSANAGAIIVGVGFTFHPDPTGTGKGTLQAYYRDGEPGNAHLNNFIGATWQKLGAEITGSVFSTAVVHPFVAEVNNTSTTGNLMFIEWLASGLRKELARHP